jgi:hypothetical protein
MLLWLLSFHLAFFCQLKHSLENTSSISEWPSFTTNKTSPNCDLSTFFSERKESALSPDVGSLSPSYTLHEVVVAWQLFC